MKIFFSIILIFTLTCIQAQAPYAFNYQGVALGEDGNPIKEKEISLLISIVRGFEDGNIIFGEEHRTMTSENGLFSLRIGQGESFIGNIRNVEWGNDQYYLRVEIDPEGGDNHVELGTTQLYSVPYALYAAEAGNASGGSIQNLELNGSVLSIENGNSVDLAPLLDGATDGDSDPTNELQNLSINATDLSISNGNTISLSSIQDGTIDADADPANEIQNLDLNGNTLSISEGNSVDLSGLGSNGGTGDEFWVNEDSETINTNYRRVRFRNGDDPATTQIERVEGNIGLLRIYNRPDIPENNLKINLLDGEFGMYGFSSGGDLTHWFGMSADLGVFELRHQDEVLGSIYASSSTGGVLNLFGPNGSRNVRLTSRAANNNRGSINVFDEDDNDLAGLYVDSQGRGIVYGTMKNFKIQHPSDRNKEIVYASLEGPEAGVYLRGTATLTNGEASIQFPEYFSLIIDKDKITVLVTPLSAESKGLSVINKSTDGFSIKELLKGNGNYQVDWEVKAIRSGFEDFQVVRDKQPTRERNNFFNPKTIQRPQIRKNE